MRLIMKLKEKAVEAFFEKKKMLVTNIYPFPTIFSILSKTEIVINATFYLSSTVFVSIYKPFVFCRPKDPPVSEINCFASDKSPLRPTRLSKLESTSTVNMVSVSVCTFKVAPIYQLVVPCPSGSVVSLSDS